MSKQVDAAIGTQRQFAKQPEMPYALRLNPLNASRGISQRTDYDTQLLASSLGVFMTNLQAEISAQDKRERDQATLINADKIFLGKTKEDLKHFDNMTALQNASDKFDLTDNKYAMAVLEQGKGTMASNYAKQQWADDPRSKKPRSVEEAVKVYGEYLEENRKEFGDNIDNQVAFDRGFYNGAMQDTMKVANEAHARIDDENRKQMRNLGQVEIQDLIASGVSGQAFADGITSSLKKIESASRDSDEYLQNVGAVFKIIGENDFTTERLNAVADTTFFGGRSLRKEVNLTPFYRKIAQNFDKRVAEDLFSKCVLPNGRLDYDKFNRELEKLPKDFVSPGIPQVPIKISDDSALAGVSPELMNVMPSVGGILSMLGAGDSMSVTGAEGSGVKIYLGESSPTLRDRIMSNLSDKFTTCKVDGDTLTLGGYLGGLENKADPREISASAFSPDRLDRIRKLAKAKDIDAKRQAGATRTRNLNAAKRGARNAVTLEEAEQSIMDSDATDEEKEWLLNNVRQSFTPMTKAQMNKMTREQRALYDYTHPSLEGAMSTYARDCNKLDEWENMSQDDRDALDETKLKQFMSAKKRVDKFEGIGKKIYGEYYQDDVYYDDSFLNMEKPAETDDPNFDDVKSQLADKVREYKDKGEDPAVIEQRIRNVGKQLGLSLGQINDLVDEFLGGGNIE